MKILIALTLAGSCAFAAAASHKPLDPVELVNPLMGTASKPEL